MADLSGIITGGGLEFPPSSAVAVTPSGNISSTNVQAALQELDTEKQATLVSGANIKTINSTSLLGSGDITTTGFANPMTTSGDIIYGGTSGAATRLAKGTDGQVLTLASGLPSWGTASGGSLLVAETTVTGSAVTSVTFSDLDGDTDGGYDIDILYKDGSGQAHVLHIFANNDLVDSNYNYKVFGVYGANLSFVSGGASPRIITTDANGDNFARVVVGVTPSRSFRWKSNYTRSASGSDLEVGFIQGAKASNLGGNLTRLDFVATQTSGIGVGSIIRLFKRI